MRQHHIGDLVVAGLNEPVSKTSAAIGIVVDLLVEHDGLGACSNEDLLFVLWPDGTVHSRWSGDLMLLKE